MRADGRCDVCGCMISSGHEVEYAGRIYHTACDPNAVLATAVHSDTDFKGELPTCLEACCNPSDTPRDPYPLGPDAGLEQKSTDATKALRTDDGLRELLA